jgi:AMP nucleosidase
MQNIEHVISELSRIYDAAVSTLRADILAYAENGTPPPAERVIERAWCYPELRIHYAGRETHPDASRAFGRLPYTGTYSTTVTRPQLYAQYLTEQLDLLAADYAIEIEVGRSTQQIPFPYVLDASAPVSTTPSELAQHFPPPNWR